MHAIHTTLGLVIESRPSGEAGKMISIFTRDLGLVRAVAQGIRLEQSKLRYYVQEYSIAEFSLVRGKEYWRLTNARQADIPTEYSADSAELVARLALILRRLLQGEEPHPELFDRVHAVVQYLTSNNGTPPERIKSLESLAVARILHALGYIAGGTGDRGLETFLASTEITDEILNTVLPQR